MCPANEAPRTRNEKLRPSRLLEDYAYLFAPGRLPGPILDLAGGDCHNGLFLAARNLPVVCADISPGALEAAGRHAADSKHAVDFWKVDLERPGANPLPEDYYGGMLVFRYLHRPLVPCIRKALRPGGLLLYETYTVDQTRFGKPHNPDFLLIPGELKAWFADWDLIHYFEGILTEPERAVAQLVCRKPETTHSPRQKRFVRKEKA
jgi:tellurite methyltransferase